MAPLTGSLSHARPESGGGRAARAASTAPWSLVLLSMCVVPRQPAHLCMDQLNTVLAQDATSRALVRAAETCQTQGRGLHQSCNNTEDINKKRLELRHNELELGSDLRGSKISITAEAPTTYAIAPAGAASRRRRSCQ